MVVMGVDFLFSPHKFRVGILMEILLRAENGWNECF